MQVDEHPRPDTTMEDLQKLPPVFKKDGVVTAGNASVGVTTQLGLISRQCVPCAVAKRGLLDTLHADSCLFSLS